MAWTSPLTWVAQNLTAARLNEQLRDNMNETAPGIASAAGRMIVTDGANSIVERDPDRDQVTTEETTSSSTYTDLATAGPAVTVSSGARVLICLQAQIRHTATPTLSFMGVDITGATTRSPSDNRGLAYLGPDTTTRIQVATVFLEIALTPGSHTFTAKYKIDAGGGTTRFSKRVLTIIPL